jgi:multiple sugar transport system ATP-binding protein
MNDGELQQVATPIDAYYRPANRFVGGFIGSPSMNFFDVTFDESGDRTFEHASFSLATDSRIQDALAGGPRELTIGIRPEDIGIAREATDTSIAVTIDVIEPLGKEQLIYFSLDGVTYTASVSGQRTIPEGDRVELEFPPRRLHLFERDSGQTILNCAVPEEDAQEAAGGGTSGEAMT